MIMRWHRAIHNHGTCLFCSSPFASLLGIR